MRLYHGSNMIIGEIDLSKSKPYKDFGRGFYLSADKAQSLRMAENRTNITREGTPIVNEYELDDSAMNDHDLKIKAWNDYCVEWALFVERNRDSNKPAPHIEHDIVFGPIANDGVNFQLRRYKAGMITIEELVKELKYSKGIAFRYCFLTERALNRLKKT